MVAAMLRHWVVSLNHSFIRGRSAQTSFYCSTCPWCAFLVWVGMQQHTRCMDELAFRLSVPIHSIPKPLYPSKPNSFLRAKEQFCQVKLTRRFLLTGKNGARNVLLVIDATRKISREGRGTPQLQGDKFEKNKIEVRAKFVTQT